MLMVCFAQQTLRWRSLTCFSCETDLGSFRLFSYLRHVCLIPGSFKSQPPSQPPTNTPQVLLLGSHILTGTIAWIRITDSTTTCALIFAVVSAIILFGCAIPPSFHEFSWLGYIDFVSIIVAILATMIATGIDASHLSNGGLNSVDWSLWPPDDISFSSAFLSVTNIVFAYSFAICQFSFMDELHTVTDFPKAIYSLGIIEIIIYTLTGAIIYAFVGNDVQSPALLSAGFTMSRIVFGLALPVIFISGSINSTVAARYIVKTYFREGSDIYYTTGRAGWAMWLFILIVQTVLAFVIAEAIPFFGDLLGIISALFSSGFSFYFPALFWFLLVKEGSWRASWRNIGLSLLNGLCFLVGLVVLGAGTYASVQDIVNNYSRGTVRSPFTCDSRSYL